MPICSTSCKSVYDCVTNVFRYSGYIAWRGVMRAGENPKVAEAIRKAYDMGNTLYFDVAQGTHSVLYELPEERLNWLWYAPIL